MTEKKDVPIKKEDLLNITKPRLTYFSSRGRGELLRIILAASNSDYEEIRVGEWGPVEKPAHFLAIKKSGILPFDSLPLYQEPEGILLVQSDCILRYLSTTKGLIGKNVKETALCDMVYEGVLDCVSTIFTNTSKGKNQVTTIINKFMQYFDTILKGNNGGQGYFVGDGMTYADLSVWYLLENLTDQGLLSLQKFPTLEAFKARIEALKSIADYRKNPKRCPVQNIFPPETK